MLTLFEEYKNSGKISDALLIGQNIFNKNPGDKATFEAYFSYLCHLAENLPSPNDKMKFAEQAGVVLAFYSENADLDNDIISFIAEQRTRIDKINIDLDEEYRSKADEYSKEVEQSNSQSIKKLFTLKDKLLGASTQKDFEKILSEIGKVDVEIAKDYLTPEQNEMYESLTKEHTDIISEKMRELEYKKNVAYNKKAADAFADAFNKFKADESKYKNHTQLFTLASKTLFAYDASMLFNETLIYYNHVYSYIFSKLDDDGKLALTRYSIECERKLR